MADNEEYGKVIDLEQYSKDGRLTEPNNGVRYRDRDMIEKVKELGRPLTEEEADEFIIKDNEEVK